MKLKKLYYMPGMISLIGIPVLLFICAMPVKKDYRVVKLFIPCSDETLSCRLAVSDNYLKEDVGRKKKISLKLQGLHWHEASLSYCSDLKNINKKIGDFYIKGDTSSVLDIQLSECNVYGDFVWLCNEMLIHNIKRYNYLDYHFYVFAQYGQAPNNQEVLEVEIFDL